MKTILYTLLALMIGVQNLSAQRNFRQWALTPPMGWNSWDCYGPTVEEHEVKANADYMAEKLKPYGWEYIVVDIRWFVENDKAGGYNQTDPRYVIDEWGRYTPAVNRFPSAANGNGFKPLADYIHSKGLKFGIHIMRGVPKVAVDRKLPIKETDGITADQIYSTELQCRWLRDNYTVVDKPGAQEYYNSIMELYASWGVDFIKIDDLSKPYHDKEIEMIRKAIDLTGRPIVLSMSPGATPVANGAHASSNANMWRMVDDVWDIWKDLTNLMKVSQDWYRYIAPGTWPDCDMIPLGRISIRGERGADRMTRLTRDEQYSLMTFFAIFRSPLMFGGDLPSNDEFTLSLLTNPEVLRMHREGTDVRQLFQQDGKLAVTSRHPKTGGRYLAVFNISDHAEPMKISVTLSDVGIFRKCTVINLWTGKDEGTISGEFSVTLPAHVSGLYLLTEIPPQTQNTRAKDDKVADKPLFRDPVYDGAADPVIVWNKKEKLWYMFYTNRRASDENLRGVTWVHGTDIGIATSSDGASWKYKGTANIGYKPDAEPTYWAPDVIEHKGVYHMFLTYVPGIFTNWSHPRDILHLTSNDLVNWRYESTLKLCSNKVIDAAVIQLPDGRWRMWYNDETTGKSIAYAESDDLYNWKDYGVIKEISRCEGPKVFRWKGKYWMITDEWKGFAIFSSDDALKWTRQPGNILQIPGKGLDDMTAGLHCDVVVQGDRAWVFYFTHPGRTGGNLPDNYSTRRSSLQVAELFLDADQTVFCQRDMPAYIYLKGK